MSDVRRLLRDDTEHNGVEYVLATDYDALTARVAELNGRIEKAREVVAYYADLRNHQGNPETGHVPAIDDDELGNRARAFLHGQPPADGEKRE